LFGFVVSIKDIVIGVVVSLCKELEDVVVGVVVCCSCSLMLVAAGSLTHAGAGLLLLSSTTTKQRSLGRSASSSPSSSVPQSPPFVYEPMFQHSGKSTTEYEKISNSGVECVNFGGKNVVMVQRPVLTNLATECFNRINHLYRAEHLNQLKAVFDDTEASDNDRYVCLEMLENACIASKWKLPMCQDTGTAIIMAKKGQHVWTEGQSQTDEEALSHGVYNAYVGSNFRYSQNAPLSMFVEKNTRTNLPAQIDIAATPGSCYDFLFIAKGGGSSNKTFLHQKTQAILNKEALLAFIKENLMSIGTSACPPYHFAIVIGGTSPEFNLKTVKLASVKELDNLPTTGSEHGRAFRDIQLEKEIEKLCRDSNIGAQYGGKYFALDTRVIRLPRHGASCLVGLGVSCSADRQIKAKITENGIFVEKLESDPSKYLPSQEVQSKIKSAPATKIDLNRPMKEILSELNKLPIRSRVMLSGPIIVARDLAHSRLHSQLKKGVLPEYFKNHIIYYAGPAKTPVGLPSGSFGPTTAGRMDPYLPDFMARGASLVTLAKGNRAKQVIESCRKYGGFYLGSVGGPAAKLAQQCITKVELLDFADLGMEAVWKIHVKDFPAFVVVDNKGNDMFANL